MMVWSFNSNTTSGASSGAGTAFPFGTHESTQLSLSKHMNLPILYVLRVV